MPAVHVVLPGDIDDPAAPSGGNAYDRRICAGLAAAGWTVREHGVPGDWPHPDEAARARLAGVLAALPEATTVLYDGLVASAVPELLAAQVGRLRQVVLVHMPLGDDAEARGLPHADALVTTSGWTRELLLARHRIDPDRVTVAVPGVDPADVAAGTAAGTALLCVAAVTPVKGHDVLVDAVTGLAGRPWTLDCVGALDRDPAFVAALRQRVDRGGLAGRVRWHGPLTGPALAAAYAGADLLVLPSRAETYGMVVVEALARGLPVLGTTAGGVPEALGRAGDGTPPGMLVPPDDPVALAGALRRWLHSADLRDRLRRAARDRRVDLPGWSATTTVISQVLDGVRT
ncbi:glycosyltransferase family 4 protein [Micromonospora antibiotica]|uniref:Glycosyltransferase family 4 protein n=1 Tax=Micromonospora antibiotica TaxID=2807623 RepID=A0ABS3V5T3_9ACTN|nr:glycosyltransferase family 4 protein [Micromonospora antibiotica]MBO4160953.1 glycosyltransferase family 4 protein [Micromonospora antibiotica]